MSNAEWFRSNLRYVFVVTTAIALLLLGPSMTTAQEGTPSAVGSTASVSVTGSGAVMIGPDAAQASIGVEIVGTSLSEALSSSNAATADVLDALRAAGIVDEDIQTASFSVQTMQDFDDQGNPTAIASFRVSNIVSVVIREIDSVGAVLDAAVSAGANTIYGVDFIVIDSGDAVSQARQLAVQDATAKATELAEAAGLSLGPVILIQEISSAPPVAFAADEAVGTGGARSVPIESGRSTITVQVAVEFQLV